MKRTVLQVPLAAALLVAICAAGFLAPATATLQDPAVEARVAELEAKVQALEAYLAAQAKSAKTLTTALETSEKEGFTFGINPRSREVLLEGLRGVAKSLQTNAPKGQEAEPEESGRRR